MTDTIALPRSVVEQALEDLEMTINYVQSPTRREDMRDSIEALRAALEQPQGKQTQMNAAQKDAVFEASIHFIGSLTGMSPPPIEVAPQEIFKPFRDFAEQICLIFSDAKQQPSQPLPFYQIHALFQKACMDGNESNEIIAFARAIEAAHGIKEQK